MDYDRLTRRHVLGTISAVSLSGCLGTLLNEQNTVDPPSTIEGTWKTARAGEYNQNSHSRTTAAKSGPQLVWSEPTPFVEGTPIITDGSVFVGETTGMVYRFNGLTGTIEWKKPIENESFTTSAAAIDETLLVSGAGGVYGLDISSGTVRWTISTPGPASNVNIFDGDAYFTSKYVGSLYRVNPHSGSVHWKTAIPGSGIIPAVDSDFVYSLGITGDFFVHNRHTGTTKLRYQLAEGVSHPVVLTDDLAVISTMQGVIYGIDIHSKKFIQWDYRTGRDAPLFAPTIQNGLIYVSDGTGRLIVLDPATGEKRWATVLEELVDYVSVTVGPSGSTDRLYALGPNGNVTIFDITGSTPKQVGTVQPGAVTYSGYPAITGNMLFIAGSVVAGYRIS